MLTTFSPSFSSLQTIKALRFGDNQFTSLNDFRSSFPRNGYYTSQGNGDFAVTIEDDFIQFHDHDDPDNKNYFSPINPNTVVSGSLTLGELLTDTELLKKINAHNWDRSTD